MMKMKNSSDEKIFCPMCRLQRKIRSGTAIHWSMIIILLPASVIMTYMFTGGVDARTILFWVAFVIVSELVAIVVNRVSMICQYCGFDPILYKKNKVQAMHRVKERLEQSKKRYNEQPIEKNAYSSLLQHMRSQSAVQRELNNRTKAKKPNLGGSIIPQKGLAPLSPAGRPNSSPDESALA